MRALCVRVYLSVCESVTLSLFLSVCECVTLTLFLCVQHSLYAMCVCNTLCVCVCVCSGLLQSLLLQVLCVNPERRGDAHAFVRHVQGVAQFVSLLEVHLPYHNRGVVIVLDNADAMCVCVNGLCLFIRLHFFVLKQTLFRETQCCFKQF